MIGGGGRDADGGMRIHGANHSWGALYSLTGRVEKQPGAGKLLWTGL
jgi:hypothetical protein